MNAETLRSGGKLLESTGRSIIAELDKITQMADAVLNQFCEFSSSCSFLRTESWLIDSR